MSGFVGYYRVSTAGQGRSGLGLDAQKASVAAFVRSRAGTVVAEFEEIESGAKKARPRLTAAIAYCRANKATLVIAKIDRLARDVAFVSALYASDVEFVAADMPQACKMTVQIMAVMAEHERDLISQRTRASLEAAKRRGVRLGNPAAAAISPRGVAANKAAADDFALRLAPTINAMRAGGITSYARLAATLEASRIKTQRGGMWTAAGVRNIILRIEKLEGAGNTTDGATSIHGVAKTPSPRRTRLPQTQRSSP